MQIPLLLCRRQLTLWWKHSVPRSTLRMRRSCAMTKSDSRLASRCSRFGLHSPHCISAALRLHGSPFRAVCALHSSSRCSCPPSSCVGSRPTENKQRAYRSLTLHNIPSSPQIPNWLHSAILAPALDAIDRRLASHLGALRLVVARCASIAIRSVLLPLLRSAVRRVPDADVLCLAESVSALGREFQAENTRRLQASVAPLILQPSSSSNGGADKTNMAAAIDAKRAVPRAHEQLAIKQRPTNQISETIVRRNVAPKRSDASKRQSIM